MKKILLLTFILGAGLLFAGAGCYKSSSNANTNSSNPVATNQISVKNFAFNPSDITVAPGTNVTWTNDDSTEHTVTSNDNLFNQAIQPGQSFSFTFNNTGTFAYHCSIHSNMTGQVVVK